MAMSADALAPEDGKTPALTKLDLRNRKLDDGQLDKVGSLIKATNASIVDLGNNLLSQLPVAFPECVSQKLILSGNAITSVRVAFSALSALKELDLSSNKLESLVGVECLKSLVT